METTTICMPVRNEWSTMSEYQYYEFQAIDRSGARRGGAPDAAHLRWRGGCMASRAARVRRPGRPSPRAARPVPHPHRAGEGPRRPGRARWPRPPAHGAAFPAAARPAARVPPGSARKASPRRPQRCSPLGIAQGFPGQGAQFGHPGVQAQADAALRVGTAHARPTGPEARTGEEPRG